VQTRFQVIKAAQVEALKAVVEFDHPKAGRLRQMRNAARFEGTPAQIRRAAPALGEHSAELLAEVGYSAAEIAGLRADGVINKG
jgi:crotonobetainyl-CoA:carnitine CoA-transferase CaiB-like acyl-CoA transferase